MSFNLYIDSIFNDFRVKDKKLVFIRGVDCVAQQIRVALQVQLGEWYLDGNIGMPLYSATRDLNDNSTPGILGGKLSAAEISAIIRREILSVPNTISIQTLEIQPVGANRNLAVNAKVLVETFDINGIGTQDVASIQVEL